MTAQPAQEYARTFDISTYFPGGETPTLYGRQDAYRYSFRSEKPVDQRYLCKANCGYESPDKDLAKCLSALFRFAYPELELKGADLNCVAVTQQECFRSGVAVDGGERIRRRLKDESLGWIQTKRKMVIPNPGFFQLKIGIDGTTDLYRKTAGIP